VNLDEIVKTDLSSITYRSVRERRKDFRRKTPNTIFLFKDKNILHYSSPSTKNRNKTYKILVKKDKNNDIFFHCTCSAFNMQGFAYRAHSLGCGIKKETRRDYRWRKYHGKNTVLCKHLWILFHKDIKKLKNNLERIKK
jgi:hypothetical protein